MSDGEKASLASGMAEWDHYKSNYAPLEKEYLEASDKDYTSRARAQAAAAVMQAGTQGLMAAGSGGGVTDAAAAVSEGLTTSQTAATNQAQALHDTRLVGALGVGRELATDTTTSMASLARSGATSSINKMQTDLKSSIAKSQSNAQLAGSLVGSGVAYGQSQGLFSGQASSTTDLYSQIDTGAAVPANPAKGGLYGQVDARY